MKRADIIDLHQISGILAGNVKSARLINSYTQKDVADLLGVTYQQIQKYESGVNRITAVDLLLISNFLKIPIDSFFEKNLDIKSTPEVIEGLDAEALKLLKTFKSIKNQAIRKRIIEFCAAFENF